MGSHSFPCFCLWKIWPSYLSNRFRRPWMWSYPAHLYLNCSSSSHDHWISYTELLLEISLKHFFLVLGCTKSLQSCPTLCNPIDSSLLGSSVHGILQGRILEWVALPSSKGSSWPRNGTQSLVSPALASQLFINSATWEATYVSIIYVYMHTHTVKYYLAIKNKNNAICSNMNVTRHDHTKWSKSERERQIPYDSSHM